MKKQRFSEEQIVAAVKQMDAGRRAEEIGRELGVSKHAVYGWKKRYGGLEANEAQRLRRLEEENRKLKHLVADLTLDNQALKGLITKNGWSL